MQLTGLLEQIWRGDVAPAGRGAAGPGRLLARLVPVPVLHLHADGPFVPPRLLSDSVELAPDLPLGDVLAEELDLDLPHGSFVLLTAGQGPADIMRAPSRLAGLVVGALLIEAAESGIFPLERELEALHTLFSWYHTLGGTRRMRAAGLDAAAFRAGLSAALRAHWVGNRHAPGIGDLPSAAEALLDPARRRFLARLGVEDPGDAAAMADPALAVTSRRSLSYDAWLDRLGGAVGARMGLAPEAYPRRNAKLS